MIRRSSSSTSPSPPWIPTASRKCGTSCWRRTRRARPSSSRHILSEIERTCHRVGIMSRGRLLAEDTMADLQRRLADEVELELELETVTETILSALQSLSFVVVVEAHGSRLRVKTKANQDYRGQISS